MEDMSHHEKLQHTEPKKKQVSRLVEFRVNNRRLLSGSTFPCLDFAGPNFSLLAPLLSPPLFGGAPLCPGPLCAKWGDLARLVAYLLATQEISNPGREAARNALACCPRDIGGYIRVKDTGPQLPLG